MENKNDSFTKGILVKHGKLIYAEILIKATPEKVWKEFTAFESYPSWNPLFKSLKGTPTVGNKIETILQLPGNKPMTIKPKVLIYDFLHQLRWCGSLIIPYIFDGEHAFVVKDNKNGTTTFMQFERFRGILVPLMKKMLDNNTKEGFNQMNQALKIRCENK